MIALRVRQQEWPLHRSMVRARGDNVTMLTLLLRLKSSSAGVNLIARECALMLAAACYKPIAAEHVPGPANDLADKLSRKYDGKPGWRLPAALSQARGAAVPARPRSWFRALAVGTSLCEHKVDS